MEKCFSCSTSSTASAILNFFILLVNLTGLRWILRLFFWYSFPWWLRVLNISLSASLPFGFLCWEFCLVLYPILKLGVWAADLSYWRCPLPYRNLAVSWGSIYQLLVLEPEALVFSWGPILTTLHKAQVQAGHGYQHKTRDERKGDIPLNVLVQEV